MVYLVSFRSVRELFSKQKVNGAWHALTSTHKFACVWTHMQMSHITKGRRRVESEPMGNGAEGWGQGWGNELTENGAEG